MPNPLKIIIVKNQIGIKINALSHPCLIGNDDSEFEFSDGFTDLHTKSYENILNDKGYGLEQARKSIEIIHDIRHSKISELISDYHPFVKKPQTKHPFFK